MTKNQITDTAESMKLANAGNAEAQFELAMHYLSEGFDNLKLALNWLMQSAENNHAAAQFTLALVYLVNKHEDIAKVLFYNWVIYSFEKTSKNNQDHSREKLFIFTILRLKLEQFNSGIKISEGLKSNEIEKTGNKVREVVQECLSGIDVSENDKLAISWFLKAAENHHPEAMIWLDACYHGEDKIIPTQVEMLMGLYQACSDGKLETDKIRAETLACAFLEEVAHSDNDEHAGMANYLLAIKCFENGYSRAYRHPFNCGLEYLKDAIDCGNVDVLTLFENAFLRFTFSEFYDREDAEACYQFAHNWIVEHLKEDADNVVLNFAFGVLLAFGKGVEKDTKRAIECLNQVYIQAQGYVSALGYFADIYLRVCGGKARKIMEPNILTDDIEWYFSKTFNPNKAGYYVLPSLIFDFYDDNSSHRAFSRKLDKAKGVFHSNPTQRELEWKKKYTELEARRTKEIEEIMSMFAHKFRSPLDAIIYNTEHEHQEKLYRQAAQTMRGLLDIFSLVATDADKLQERLKQDCRGNGSLVTAFSKVLDMVLLHLLSVSASEKIRQHYLSYAMEHALCDAETTLGQWNEDYFELERQLQSEWERNYAQLIGQSATLEQRLAWVEQHFFRLQLSGFEHNEIKFREYGDTESLLTIVLNEFLTNAFKYYSSSDHLPVVLEWTGRDGFHKLSCRNPSTSQERERIKGSNKGHKFLAALARKVDSEFIKPKPSDNFVVEFALADELLMSN